MENRFGVKDFFLFLLLIVLIVGVFLAMKQFDRQWEDVQAIKQKLSEQTNDIARLSRTIEQGVRVSAATQAADAAAGPSRDPFVYVKKAQQNNDYAIGGRLIDQFPVRVARLSPLGLSGDLYSRIVQNRIQECLAYVDPYTLEYIPLLASDWRIKDNSGPWRPAYEALKQRAVREPLVVLKELGLSEAQHKELAEKLQSKELKEIPHDALVGHPALPPAVEITFQLRRGVSFSDGVPFTADDVVFTFDWIMNPAVAAPRERAYFAKVKSVEKINDGEVVFKFKEPYYESFSLAAEALQILPRHFYSKYTPEQFNSSPGLLMGTGPYRMKTPDGWKPGELIELVRNERYWGEPAPYDRIIWYEIESDTAGMTRFKNGESDLYAATPEQYEEMLKDPSILTRANNYKYEAPQGGYSYVGWNERQKGKPTPFADKRVRQAMTLLTDRDNLIKEIMLGHGRVASGPFSPLLDQSDPEIKPWPYDPAQAKALLKAAGYEDRNGDGVIEGPDGAAFRFKLTYGSKSPLIERIALFLKDSYARAGISMELDPCDWPIMLRKIDGREYDAITLAWGGSIESDPYQVFHSSQMADNGDNFISYSNPEADKLMEQARASVDKDQRMPLWHQVHRILHEDQPYMFLVSRVSLVFIDKKIKNIERAKLGLNYSQLFVMPIPWYIPKEMQRSR
jgi:peptide/nickel transport system substrate-binding protein